MWHIRPCVVFHMREEEEHILEEENITLTGSHGVRGKVQQKPDAQPGKRSGRTN